jgi:hypothetical protein
MTRVGLDKETYRRTSIQRASRGLPRVTQKGAELSRQLNRDQTTSVND